MAKVSGDHPGNVGGEHAASKASRDAGARNAGGSDKDGLGRAPDPRSTTTPSGALQNGPRDYNSMESNTEDPAATVEKNRQAVGNQKAYRDYSGEDDGILDKIGNVIAHAFGFRELNPYDEKAPNPTGPKAPSITGEAGWAVDPLDAALSIGGMVNPMLGVIGYAYKGMKMATGFRGLDVSLDSGTPADVPNRDTIGVDGGKTRAIAPAAPRGTTPATPTPIAPGSEQTSDQLLDDGSMQTSGRNRNYRLLSPTAAPIL